MKAHSHEPMNRHEPRRMSRHYPTGSDSYPRESPESSRVQTPAIGSLEYVKGNGLPVDPELLRQV
jgi:hypothetical protein